MAQAKINPSLNEWTPNQKIIFRFFFVYFLIQILPLDWKFYKFLFSINWPHIHFKEILDITSYTPKFISQENIAKWGISSFANWGIAALIAIAGTVLWSSYDRGRKEYNLLYYWLRVILRYRLALGLIAYGFYKLFHLQMPYPSLSNLNTNYGDFFSWKIYYQTTAIAPNYESFLGMVELVAGFLLFYRKTTTFGAGLVIGFTGNVAVANGFYDIGNHTYSTFLVLIAAFLLAYDVPRLYSLLVYERKTLANKFHPYFPENGWKKTRFILKRGFLLFVLFSGYKAYSNFKQDPFKIPHTPGLKGAFGLYNVSEFRLNDDTLAYSLTDPNRWQDVIFEKWSTLSIKVNRPVKIDVSSGDTLTANDIDRNYELAGLAGRHYFYYEADTLNHRLVLQNKNKHHRSEKLLLTYSFPNDSTLYLSGINENNDSIYVKLNKVNKKYMMLEGRRKPVKI